MQPVPADFQLLGPGIWRSDMDAVHSGLKVVGTPIGTDDYVKQVSSEIVDEEMQLLNRIPQLASLQVSWLILFFCAVPRLNHLLRTLAPRLVEQLAESHDSRIQEVFASLFHVPSVQDWSQDLHDVSHDSCMRQAKLPMRLGGCGLRDSRRTSPAAYWASWADTLPILVQRFPAVGAAC